MQKIHVYIKLQIDDEHKKSFIDGLMDQSDRTTRIMMVKNTKASSFAGKYIFVFLYLIFLKRSFK